MAKMSSSANQPVCVGQQALEQRAAHPHEPEARRAEQVLDGAARDDVGAERADVDLDRADGLVAVGEDDRAVRVRGLGDRGHVVPVPCTEGERGAADQRGAIVDRVDESARR